MSVVKLHHFSITTMGYMSTDMWEQMEAYDPRVIASCFPNLNDFDSLEALENLTVKQLKQVLTLNCVDYKSCCEKQELFERVSRLWKILKSCPAIEKLSTDELCKICNGVRDSRIRAYTQTVKRSLANVQCVDNTLCELYDSLDRKLF